GKLKVSVKSSYFRLTPRPSFIVYGKKGSFVKETKDRQEEHLKQFYMPTEPDFGVDLPQHYGTLTYMDDDNHYHQEKVISEVGDYSRFYEDVYQTLINKQDKVVKDKQTLLKIKLLEEGAKHLSSTIEWRKIYEFSNLWRWKDRSRILRNGKRHSRN